MKKIREDFYLIDEMSELLDIPIQTLHRVIKEKKIKCIVISPRKIVFPKDEFKKSMKIEKAAIKLGISISSVRNLINEEKIKVTNYGERLTRITEEEIDIYLSSNTILPKDPKSK